ncbi:hypothetical protein N7528_003752 [Penicillium herquei]|nr:hypothetical protein N7528_003752 [Penicillium herquei]
MNSYQEIALPILGGYTTFENAIVQEKNMFHEFDRQEAMDKLLTSFENDRREIEQTAAYHLRLSSSMTCKLAPSKEWLNGSFNVCMPVYVKEPDGIPEPRAMIRFAMPYELGEPEYPGNVNEKLRCEAATFIWIRENCPDVPIPRLLGFGLVGGQSFTTPENVPFIARTWWYFKRYISWLCRYPLPCNYVPHSRSTMLESGYLVMTNIGSPEVRELMETWRHEHHNKEKRTNLFRGLSQVILSLSQIPLPRIGSWTLDSDGVLRLSNRPLTLRIHALESNGIPTNISRTMTYPSSDGYYNDLLAYHENRIIHQPNSISGKRDGRVQVARLTMMRAILHSFINRDFRDGPFLFRLTDISPRNIFVDSDWNVKFVIDLEWACSHPAEMLRAPYWVSARSLDGVHGEHISLFNERYEEFLDIFEEEEKLRPPINGVSSFRADLMRKGFRTGNNWYFEALDNPRVLFNMFEQHIHPIFVPDQGPSSGFGRILSRYWIPGAWDFIAKKLQDQRKYERDLRRRFGEDVAEPHETPRSSHARYWSSV